MQTKINLSNFVDVLKILSKDPDGKKYFKTSRIICQSILLETELWIDLNNDLLNATVGEILNVNALVSDCNFYDNYSKSKYLKSIFNHYEYILLGKIFRITEAFRYNTTYHCIYASFGGLLMKLTINSLLNTNIKNKDYVYFFISKI